MKKVSSKFNCRSCHSVDLTKILSLGDQYLSDFTPTPVKMQKYPLDLFLCRKCYLVQIEKTVDQKKLYNERYGYKSGINQTMKVELAQIVSRSVSHMPLKPKDIVIDIGANDGTLLSNYPKDVIRVAIEPIAKLATEASINADFVINDFFSLLAMKKLMSKELIKQGAKIITAISMFYDLEKPNDFMADIKKILAPDGIFIISQNYLLGMLEQNAFDNIVHEHIEYYSLLSLEKLLSKHDLEIFDVEKTNLNGGSFRTYICHKNSGRTINHANIKKMRAAETKAKLHLKETYLKFEKRVSKSKEKVVKFIQDAIKKGKKIYIYGASTRGNTILQYYGLDNKMITAAVERNPEKWGKVISSTNIPIISEAQARIERPDYLLVLPWFFKDEFLQREANYLRNGGHFIFPLPKFEVI